MEINQMGCCAFNEIVDLSDNYSAANAMRDFCSDVIEEQYDTRRNLVKEVLNPGAFYIFTAIVKSNDRTAGTYGHNFADLIRKNKLGKLKLTMKRLNRKNEPGHQIQGWIWAPSKKALTAWWAKNRGSND